MRKILWETVQFLLESKRADINWRMKHEVGDNVRKNTEVKSGLQLKLLFTSLETVHGMQKRTFPLQKILQEGNNWGKKNLPIGFLPAQTRNRDQVTWPKFTWITFKFCLRVLPVPILSVWELHFHPRLAHAYLWASVWPFQYCI